MSNTVKALIVAAVVATVGVVGVLTLGGSSDKPETQTTTKKQTSNTTNNDQAKKSTQQSEAVVITYSDSGFSPASTTIKAGQSIVFKNSSSNDLDLESNPHPVHTDNTELNIGSIASGASQTVTLDQTGSWGFHNHSNSSHQANVEVE